MPPEREMAGIVDRLTRAGYDEVFRAEAGGVRGLHRDLLHAPHALVVEQVERFEGVSDPEDQAIVLALRCHAHGCRGTYIAPYGNDMPALDAAMIGQLQDTRRRG